MGNGDFFSTERSLWKYLKGCGLPEVEVFLQEFLPSYGLELDQMQI